ncbi:hypothetical protein TI05_02980 [Achromatium sp. WMS3]|nr:hypothetical protein TI05_02980 [Achromatium sp. WMS3]
MAYASIIFENPNTGFMKTAPVGYSWTTLFFGPFPALSRGDWKWGLIITALLIPGAGVGTCAAFALTYNKLYIKDLISAGYKAKSITNGNMDYAAVKLGFNIPRLQS